jgi:hypothetical protein
VPAKTCPCPRFPRLHENGKEGVNGSSPLEGFSLVAWLRHFCASSTRGPVAVGAHWGHAVRFSRRSSCVGRLWLCAAVLYGGESRGRLAGDCGAGFGSFGSRLAGFSRWVPGCPEVGLGEDSACFGGELAAGFAGAGGG